jgi:hypothetical protein
VKNLESGFVARQPELALELDSRHAGRLASNKVRTPKPDRKRRVRAFHDRASSKAGVAAIMTLASTLRCVETYRGSSATAQCGQTKPSLHRARSRYSAHAASSGNRR